MNTFQFCLSHVLESEGGFVNHPKDKGGPTNFGITIATLSAWRKAPCTLEDVKSLTEAEAGQIYEQMYWRPLGLANFSNKQLACIIFDQGVNRGVKAAVESLQTVLNKSFGASIEVDGIFGGKTAKALEKVDNWKLAVEYIKAAQEFYFNLVQRNPGQSIFLRGWIARTWKLLDILV